MTEDLVKRYYSEQGIREWRRLVRDPYHQLEFETTMHFIKKHLPRKRGLILDAGGGPGRYTIEFCRLGHNVVLLDLSSEMLKIAEKRIKRHGVSKRVKQVIHGSINDLSMFKDETFDAVTCLGGPLSHLVEKKRREEAINELVRVAKKNSPIIVSVISRLALLVTELTRFPKEIETDIFLKIRDTGNYRGGYGFAPCHFYLPEELKHSLEKKGLQILETVGLEGLASGHQKDTNRLAKEHPKAWKIWWETHFKTCTLPVSVGISEHFMLICRKPQRSP